MNKLRHIRMATRDGRVPSAPLPSDPVLVDYSHVGGSAYGSGAKWDSPTLGGRSMVPDSTCLYYSLGEAEVYALHCDPSKGWVGRRRKEWIGFGTKPEPDCYTEPAPSPQEAANRLVEKMRTEGK